MAPSRAQCLAVLVALFSVALAVPGSGAFDREEYSLSCKHGGRSPATPLPPTIAVYYKSSWSTVYLHYDAGEGWNSIPGAQLEASANASFPPPWQFIEVAGNTVTWVMTDGNGNWDNNGGKNCEFLVGEEKKGRRKQTASLCLRRRSHQPRHLYSLGRCCDADCDVSAGLPGVVRAPERHVRTAGLRLQLHSWLLGADVL